jgi:hypothetical protein
MHRIHTEKLILSERKQIWKEILQTFKASGLSQKTFCHQHSIKDDLLLYLQGVSTRKVTKITEKLCGFSLTSTDGGPCLWVDWKRLGKKYAYVCLMLLQKLSISQTIDVN